MKNIKFLILSAVLILLSACSNVDFGNINKNTNGATEYDAASLMGGAMMQYATVTGRNYITIPTLYVQYQSQVTYVDEMLYNEAAQSWYSYYVQCLSNLQTVINMNSDPAQQTKRLLDEGYPANQIGVAMIMKAVIAKRITDTYGDIPYSQALDPSTHLPAYDTQEAVYNSLISDVKAARDMMDAGQAGPTGDVIYGGDVVKWKKFANSFLLQTTLQLSKRFPSASGMAATEFKSALNNAAGVIESVGDEAWFNYDENVAAFQNPWFSGNRTRDYFLSQEFTDALKGNDGSSLNPTSNRTPDSRIAIYAQSTTKDGVPYGHRDGSGSGKNQMSEVNFWAAGAPLPIMTAAYTFLNRADAANMGWTSENAGDMLTAGITMSYASLSSHALSGTDITSDATAYAAARLADAVTVGMGQVISEEKWIALFPNGFDAWSEWRRTGIPDLKPTPEAFNDGTIPRRYLYPSEESTINEANYTTAVGDLSPATDHNYSRIWWDQ
jgi:hypothetical protein